jgi:3',5'-cyclic AMP phosphodiesterase CpdA
MRLGWLSDIHLNHVHCSISSEFLASLKNDVDALIITGDINDNIGLYETLLAIDRSFDKTTFFVLGNHDYYGGSINATRRALKGFLRDTKNLTYLDGSPLVELSPTTVLVGCDGWGDGRYGSIGKSDVILNDFSLIEELHYWKRDELDKPKLRLELEKLGDESAEHLRLSLEPAMAYKNIIIGTHVPPFREATWHEGSISGDDWLPYFSCKAVGDVILKEAKNHPDCKITVLCGHTHSCGVVSILDNLKVLTAEAEYGHPGMQQIFNIE